MHKAALWIQYVLVPALGPAGLFVAAVLDSFLFLPETNDILVVSWSASRPETVWLAVAMTTLGTVAGNSVLWWAGLRGGEPVLLRRFGKERVERTRSAFERWGLLALAIPAVLPPPVPFKVLVFGAGVFGVSFRRFVATVTLARGLRYTFWSLMGVRYGVDALALLRSADVWLGQRLLEVLGAAAALLAAGLALQHWRRARSRREAPEQP